MTTKLLAVDDSKTLRKVLEITFAGEDFQTELAASAEEALQKVRSHRPAVAIVDASLGGTSGYDLCQQIKSEAPDVAVILLPSKHRPFDQGRASQVGVDDYIDKPFDTQKLLDKVNAVLQGAPQRAAAPAPAPAVNAPPQQRPVPTAAPRPAVSAVPQRPASQVVSAPARPAAPAARPVAPPPNFGSAPRPPQATPVTAAAPPKVAAAVAAASTDLDVQLQGLGLDAQQVQGVLALSREVVERVVWEVVPVLAETLIKEEIARLTAE